MGRGNGGGRIGRQRIGAGRRRASRPSRDAGGAGAEIVVLTWAQTFGRAARSPKPGAGQGDPGRDAGDDVPGTVVVLGEETPGS